MRVFDIRRPGQRTAIARLLALSVADAEVKAGRRFKGRFEVVDHGEAVLVIPRVLKLTGDVVLFLPQPLGEMRVAYGRHERPSTLDTYQHRSRAPSTAAELAEVDGLVALFRTIYGERLVVRRRA